MSRDRASRYGRIGLSCFAVALMAACGSDPPEIAAGPATTDPTTPTTPDPTIPTSDPCKDLVCANGGTCKIDNGQAKCECLPGWSGPKCEDKGDPCVPNPCQNGGTCKGDGSGFKCDCPSGFTGAKCEKNIDDCPKPNQCENGGTCIDLVNAWKCDCPPLTSGEKCEVDLDLRLPKGQRMINTKTHTLRAEILDTVTGNVDTSGCFEALGTVTMKRASDNVNIPITVTVFDTHVPVPAGSIRFYHGIGSVSFTLDDGAAVPAGDYLVTVTVGTRTATSKLQVVSAPAWRVMPATLTGADLTWGPDEDIRISEHTTTVPAGSTLTINPGTLVMVDTTGGVMNGTLIRVNGNLVVAGTQDKPVHFFSERGPAAMIHTVTSTGAGQADLSNPESWRGIFMFGSGSSTIDHMILTGAGNGDIVSHPRPPIISLANTHNLTMQDSLIVDSTGMAIISPGTGSTVLRRVLFSRVGIGAEFLSNGNKLLIEDSHFNGIGHGPTSPVRFDGDGLHVDGATSIQTIRRVWIADVGDDCIDQSNSNFVLEDSVVHDCKDKVISLTNGGVTVTNSLLFKGGSGIRGTAMVTNSTISVGNPIDNAQVLVDSIISPQSLSSCGGGDIHHNLLGPGSNVSCGVANFTGNPQFVDPSKCDYRLQPTSPALTTSTVAGQLGYIKK